MSTPANVARGLALVGYLGLWLLLPAWYGWLAPSQQLPWAWAGILLIPLIFPLSGLLRGKRYTYAWSTFVALLYLAHGIGEAYTWPAERTYGAIEVALALLWFGGATAYVRLTRAPTPAAD